MFWKGESLPFQFSAFPAPKRLTTGKLHLTEDKKVGLNLGLKIPLPKISKSLAPKLFQKSIIIENLKIDYLQ